MSTKSKKFPTKEKKKRKILRKNLKGGGGDNSITLIKDASILVNTNLTNFVYEGADSFGSVKIILKPQEVIRADAGAMNYMTDNINIETTSGNVFSGIWRAVSGSSIFYNLFTNMSKTEDGTINFSGVNPGSVGCFYIPPNKTFCLVDDSYLCSTPNLEISTKVRFGGLIMGYGLAYIKIRSVDNKPGLLWTSSFGNVLEIKLNPGKSIKIDNGVLLGFDDTIDMGTAFVRSGFSIKSALFSGEGLVSKVENKTNNVMSLYLQGRSKIAYNDYIQEIANKKR